MTITVPAIISQSQGSRSWRRMMAYGTVIRSHSATAQEHSTPTNAKPGCICHRENPTICGPRDHVHIVFSHRIRPANKKAKGEADTHQTFKNLGKAPDICMALHSSADRISWRKLVHPSKKIVLLLPPPMWDNSSPEAFPRRLALSRKHS